MASQQKLLQLGFWLHSPDGTFDDTTRQAVMAFQKYYQLRATGSINTATAFLLERMELPATALENRKTLAEVDKT